MKPVPTEQPLPNLPAVSPNTGEPTSSGIDLSKQLQML
jgi:hypothetical protein